jgi:hypothetical protein
VFTKNDEEPALFTSVGNEADRLDQRNLLDLHTLTLTH